MRATDKIAQERRFDRRLDPLPVDELLHEEVVHTARVVLHFVGERGHLLRAAVVDGREVLLGVGVVVVFQLQLCVRRDDGQLLQVLLIQVC